MKEGVRGKKKNRRIKLMKGWKGTKIGNGRKEREDGRKKEIIG